MGESVTVLSYSFVNHKFLFSGLLYIYKTSGVDLNYKLLEYSTYFTKQHVCKSVCTFS